MFYYSKTTNCSYKKTVDRFCFYTNLSTVPIGAGAMYLATIISFNNNSNLHEWWQNNIEYAVNYNPFESIYSMVWVTACVMIAAICIYIINYKLCLKKLDINSAQKKKIALSLAVFTAPYLFYIPTALFFGSVKYNC